MPRSIEGLSGSCHSPQNCAASRSNSRACSEQKPSAAAKRAVLRAIEQIGYVQIDTISVVERAHHHVLGSRVANYRPALLEQLVRERKLFEYWFHAAAWMPMADYRFSLPRMRQLNGERHWFKGSDRKLMRRNPGAHRRPRDRCAHVTLKIRARATTAGGTGNRPSRHSSNCSCRAS